MALEKEFFRREWKDSAPSKAKPKKPGRTRHHGSNRHRDAERHGRSRALVLLGRAIARTARSVPPAKEAILAQLVTLGLNRPPNLPSIWKEWN